MNKISTVLFDLDGTLIDTAPDMAAALDTLCREENQTPLAFDVVRPYVSNGSIALVQLAFGNSLDQATLNRLKNRYLDIYQNCVAEHSTLFNEMDAVLTQLENNNIKWGVVTNKPGWLTLPLMQALNLEKRAACIVSGDSTDNRKPHPEPMHYACELSGSQPQDCMYVGDAIRDIEAGNNAGMKTVIALYGYIAADDDTTKWNADATVQSPADILNHLS